MPAETLNCPMCGAPVSSEAPCCEHCGARLAKVACPSCFGLIFQGAKFCSHCGARVERADIAVDVKEPCPRCQVPMEAIALGATKLRECPKCEGLWVDTASLQAICAERERQVEVLGMAQSNDAPAHGVFEDKVRYLPCPVCHQLMNRVNFAGYSNVVVDICKRHGTWFDRDELRRVVEFIRSGGLDKARRIEIDELEARQRTLKAAQMSGAWDIRCSPRELDFERHSGISFIADALGGILGDT